MLFNIRSTPQLAKQLRCLSRPTIRSVRHNTSTSRQGSAEKRNSESPYVNQPVVFGIIAVMVAGGYFINRYHQSKAPDTIKEK
ncbi:hypothetical protein OXX59_000290 [Metschnikowia pulcherrima]